MADFDTEGAVQGAAQGAAAGSVAGPYGALIGSVVGLGLSIFGSAKKMEAQQQVGQAEVNIAQGEIQAESLRREAMEVGARRMSMEVLRNAQRNRSLAQANATHQGAQFGSGLQGGYGQASGKENTQLTDINQQLNIGEQMFDINSYISQQKLSIAQAGQTMAVGQGLSTAGSGVLSAIQPAQNLYKQFTGSPSAAPTA